MNTSPKDEKLKKFLNNQNINYLTESPYREYREQQMKLFEEK